MNPPLYAMKQTGRGRHLSTYDLHYIIDGKHKIYEIASSDPALSPETIGSRADGVSLIIFNRDHSKMLLGLEFRMGVNRYILNTISGFIDKGETPEAAAERELYEETGLSLVKILDTLPASYISPPVTDMALTTLVCEADGIIRPSENPMERIQPIWFTREELAEELKKPFQFSARAQGIALLWSHNL